MPPDGIANRGGADDSSAPIAVAGVERVEQGCLTHLFSFRVPIDAPGIPFSVLARCDGIVPLAQRIAALG